MSPRGIAENYRRIRDSLPQEVTIVVAVKGRTAGEVAEVIEAGATAIGHNQVQAAERMREDLGPAAGSVQWHLIGHLQRNKINRALPLFDTMQSVDSLRLAQALNERAERPVTVYVEVNVGGEDTKCGVSPEATRPLLEGISSLPRVRVEGLMTMEPYCENPEDARPYFRRMRELFVGLEALKAPNIEMKFLSMGVTNSYSVAVQEGANMVRIGTAIFGRRHV
jgi:pyridoxal phosphate enzyme (YggS family)